MRLLTAQKLLNEVELLNQCELISGLSFAQLAKRIATEIPQNPIQRKGWTGNAVEIALGTTAGNKAIPDFHHLGIELKTIPINSAGRPAESTFVTSICLLTIHQQAWRTSQCYQKLKRVLWVPIEDSEEIDFPNRRIGYPFLWSPSEADENILAEDWEELVTMIGTGQLEQIDATMGRYLQIRPKAANARSLCEGYNAAGERIRTLPRGFYLRSSYTAAILAQAL